jgi:threonine aldolase
MPTVTAAPLPPAPSSSFASDNAAGASPEVLEALAAANHGPALAYGDDPWSRAAVADLRELFGAPVDVLFCFGGTGANIVALGSMLQPWQSIVTVDSAHVVVDEAGGPARFTGSQLLTVPAVDGKLDPAALEQFLGWRGVEHHPQPRVVTVSQATESGTVYSVDELGELADRCHASEMLLHVDGARVANAVVATGATVHEMFVGTGVDVVTFGLTKNGAVFGEAVVYLDPRSAAHARFVRKQAGQLVSKSRFVAAQFSALLRDDLWLRNARHANEMATLLAQQVAAVPGVGVLRPPEVNSVFVTFPWDRLEALLDWSFFWPWDEQQSVARWMTSFTTTPHDVATFAAGVQQLLTDHRDGG